MSKNSTQRIAAVISLCLIFAVIGVFFGLRQLNAQGASPGGMMMPMMMPGMGGMSGGSQSSSAVTESAPTAPLISITSVVRGIQTKNTRNWDGTVTTMLRFKYQLSPKQTLTVYLPKALVIDEKGAVVKRTRNGWEALFQSFSMDKEAIVDADIKNNPTSTQSSSGVSVGSTGMMGGGMTIPGMMSGGSSMPMLPPMPTR
jgi:hypothetical protein